MTRQRVSRFSAASPPCLARLRGFSASPAAAQQADQPAAKPGDWLEEIVVTARRREEKLQSVTGVGSPC